MSIESVRAYFAQYGIQDRIQEFPVSSATVELAAAALHCPPAHIAKTLSFGVGGQPVLIVAAGDARIDNAKYKARFGTKAKMLDPAETQALVGHQVGGICPFGIRDNVTVYLDRSLQRFDAVYPACGSANSAIRLSLEELEKYARAAGWVDVCKGWAD